MSVPDALARSSSIASLSARPDAGAALVKEAPAKVALNVEPEIRNNGGPRTPKPAPLSLQSLAGLQNPLERFAQPPRFSLKPLPSYVQGPSGGKLTPAQWNDMKGWANDDHAAAYATFLTSCRGVVAGDAPGAKTPWSGALKVVCKSALDRGPLDVKASREFFEQNFQPMKISAPGATTGMVTGYYVPVIAGSRTQHGEYQTPMYAMPDNATDKARTRTEIETGKLGGKGLELVYVKNPVDAFFAQIQGSARVQLEDGTQLKLEFAGKNERKYTSVGKVLINRGIIPAEKMSMDAIREWMEANPKEAVEVRRQSDSFVYFKGSPASGEEQGEGAQGLALTPQRSIAVDHAIHAYGTPFFINANLPIDSEQPTTQFSKLVVGMDTGDAIKGAARADLYWGVGNDKGAIAGRFKQQGTFTMLMPLGTR